MVAPETGLVFDNDRPNLSGFHVFFHLNIRGAGVVGAAKAIVNVEFTVVKSQHICVLLENDFLIGYGV